MIDPPSTTSPVGIVVVTYNSAADITACLQAVEAASSRPVTIVVVDNASTDDTVARVRLSAPDARLIVNTTNRYYAAANNQGFEHCGGQYILLLNPDVVLPVGGIDALVRILEDHPRAAAVAPRLVGADGRRQASLRELPGFDTLWYDLSGLSFLFPRSPVFGRWRMGYFDGRAACDVQQPMASCLLIRRAVLAEIGGFDERFPMFFNDVDWCRRARDAGWTIRYTPDVIVRHKGGASTSRRKMRMIWMSHVAYYRYLRRYHSRGLLRRFLLWFTAPFLFASAVLRMAWWAVWKHR